MHEAREATDIARAVSEIASARPLKARSPKNVPRETGNEGRYRPWEPPSVSENGRALPGERREALYEAWEPRMKLRS